jgi:hypothetical protein
MVTATAVKRYRKPRMMREEEKVIKRETKDEVVTIMPVKNHLIGRNKGDFCQQRRMRMEMS